MLSFLQRVVSRVNPKFRPDWCINPSTGFGLEYDFELPDLMIILELDGRQHFQQVRNWICPEEQIERDVFKMRRANEKGYSVIRLLQEEVWDGREAWLEANLRECLVRYEHVTNVFISTDETMYDRHMEMLEMTM